MSHAGPRLEILRALQYFGTEARDFSGTTSQNPTGLLVFFTALFRDFAAFSWIDFNARAIC